MRASSSRGRGAGKVARPGDVQEMGGIKLIAALGENGGIVWRPLDAPDGATPAPLSDDAWLKEKALEIEQLRVSESRRDAAQKRSEAAAIPGVPTPRSGGGGSGGGGRGGGRGGRGRAAAASARVPEPRALVELRQEAETARHHKVDVLQPRKFQVIAEALAAAEADYASQCEEARAIVYAIQRSRLGGVGGGGRAAEEEDEHDDDRFASVAQLTDDQFRALALERAERSRAYDASAADELPPPPPPPPRQPRPQPQLQPRARAAQPRAEEWNDEPKELAAAAAAGGGRAPRGGRAPAGRPQSARGRQPGAAAADGAAAAPTVAADAPSARGRGRGACAPSLSEVSPAAAAGAAGPGAVGAIAFSCLYEPPQQRQQQQGQRAPALRGRGNSSGQPRPTSALAPPSPLPAEPADAADATSRGRGGGVRVRGRGGRGARGSGSLWEP
jgi:hypothetical protein